MASSARTKSSKRKLTHSKFHKPPKHLRRGSYRADDSFEPLIIHRVICDCEGYHYDHQSHADYFDIPQLFEGDSKASALRGESLIENTDEYFEQYKDVVLALFKVYSCNAYHDAVEHKFEMLRAPKNPDVEALERYFYRLNEDCDSRTPQWEELVIVSEDLQNEIKEVTGLFVERVSTQRQSTEMDAIVNGLYNYSRRIKRAGDEVNGRSREHIANFIRWVEIVFRNEYEEADDLFVAGRVAISHLPKLFGPDEIIVTTQGDQPQAYVVAEYPEQNDDTLEIPCYTWSFNGRFWREHTNLVVKWPFSEDEVSIYDLSTYPLRFDESMRQRLLDRGKTFWQYRERRFVSYSPANSPFEFQTNKPRYMVDVKTYHHVHPDEAGTAELDYLETEAHDNGDPPNETFQLLLPATIPGFGFHNKKWITLLVENIREIEWNAEAFNHLVLKSTKKELIRALVAKHTATSNSTDVIEGKGNGLILLLHGGPGTGKTLTAESVAELTRKPLYRVTCGDIGTNAEEVEKYLESVLQLGTIWKCVVLLDEADVFLEERTQHDLQRNALVSVFLRVLEYYDGILVLTSNRIGTFDEAFKSRVQLTVHYPTLDESSRRRVWTNFITRLRSTNPEAKTDQILEKVDTLANFQLNGREIRNSVQTAMLLAEYRGQPLQFSHLDDVIEVSNEFTDYLRDMHGHGPSEWARSQLIR